MKAFTLTLLFLALLVLTKGTEASATTDYQCLGNCQEAGMTYGFCHSKCSYETESVSSAFGTYEAPKRTDYTCLDQCQDTGNSYGLCRSKCSY